ncbi:MAG: hypothetical protein IKQ31_01090 [Clostridia bacterium]|nr:hypothetical protein [Clostridia bacterium]
MVAQKLKKGLLAGVLAVACAFSVGTFAACGSNQDENKGKTNPQDETVVVTPNVISWNVENDVEGEIFVQQLKKVIADWEVEATEIKDKAIESYRKRSGHDDSTQLIEDTFKTNCVMKVDGKKYNITENDADVLLAIANTAEKVEFELTYYFEAHSYWIIELNVIHKEQNDIHQGSKVVEVVKTATNPTTVVSYK